MEPSSTMMLSALQEHDAKRPGLSQPASFNSELEPHDKHTTFSVYRSPFDSYPCLRDHPHRMLSDPFSISHDLSAVSSQPIQSSMLSDSRFSYTKPSISPYSSTDLHLPDLRPLKLASTVRLFDPLKRICQYEIPGGGTCRDEHCEDIHLNRLESMNPLGMVEPSGT
ncbi:hypothetical protein BJ912DRAFT_692975 [Pholiota molesta]|nr:hypothetical protein BJ912DRAFT_692975 [Pholiota molesta]